MLFYSQTPRLLTCFKLRALAAKASEQRESVAKRLGGSSSKAELGDAARWAPADAAKFRDVLGSYTEDLDAVRTTNEGMRSALKEIGSGLVKGKYIQSGYIAKPYNLSANTRKEEIERFKRAKDDEDFRKMLKARTLGPELLELKSRLRSELMRKKQEVMKLEEVLKEHKKKMTAMKNQKGVFRFVHLSSPSSAY